MSGIRYSDGCEACLEDRERGDDTGNSGGARTLFCIDPARVGAGLAGDERDLGETSFGVMRDCGLVGNAGGATEATSSCEMAVSCIFM